MRFGVLSLILAYPEQLKTRTDLWLQVYGRGVAFPILGSNLSWDLFLAVLWWSFTQSLWKDNVENPDVKLPCGRFHSQIHSILSWNGAQLCNLSRFMVGTLLESVLNCCLLCYSPFSVLLHLLCQFCCIFLILYCCIV